MLGWLSGRGQMSTSKPADLFPGVVVEDCLSFRKGLNPTFFFSALRWAAFVQSQLGALTQSLWVSLAMGGGVCVCLYPQEVDKAVFPFYKYLSRVFFIFFPVFGAYVLKLLSRWIELDYSLKFV